VAYSRLTCPMPPAAPATTALTILSKDEWGIGRMWWLEERLEGR